MEENTETFSGYNPQEIAPRWQNRWAEDHLYEVKGAMPAKVIYVPGKLINIVVK